jgi:hypothetical protein
LPRRISTVALCASGILCCAKNTRSEAEISSLELDLAFLVSVDSVAGWVSAPFGIDHGALTFGELPAAQVPLGSRVYLVALEKPDLLAAVPPLDPDRLALARIELGTPPQKPSPENEVRSTVLGIPAAATVFEVGAEGELTAAPTSDRTFLNRLVLHVPTTLSCPPARFVPFGPSGLSFAGKDRRSFDLRRVADSGEGWGLVMSPDLIWLARPGRALAATGTVPPGQIAPVIDVHALTELGTLEASGVALGPKPASAGPRRVLVSMRSGEGIHGAILELEQTDAGLRWLSTTTLAEGRPIPSLEDITLDEHQTSIAVGHEGTVLIRGPHASAWSWSSLPMIDAPGQTANTDVRRVIATHNPMWPHLIGDNDGVLYLGDAQSGRWASIERRSEVGGALHFYGFSPSADGREIWSVAWKGDVQRWREGEGWSRIDLMDGQIPAAIQTCGTSAAGHTTIEHDLTGIGRGPSGDVYLVVQVTGCTGAIRVRTRDLCTSAAAVEAGSGPSGWINSGADGTLLGGTQGALFRLVE